MRLLTLILWFALGSAQQSATGSVEGTVLRTGTTDPIERVQVTLVNNAPTPMRALTDKEGHFSFPTVAPGRYAINIQRDSYLVPGSTLSVAGFQSSQENVADPTAAAVNVGTSEHVTGLTYYLTPGGTISGRILDPSGRPAVSADVYALRLVYQEGRPTVSPVKAASTNDRGEYRMYWLEPGDYIVRAQKALPAGPARAYYPGTANAATAVRVRVSEGAESPKVDISIRKDETFKISGTLTNIVAGLSTPAAIAPSPVTAQQVDLEALKARLVLEAAQAPSVPQFFLSPVDPSEIYDGVMIGMNALTSAQDRAAGNFEIRNVRAGSYNLIAVVTDRSSSPPRYFTGRTPVDVSFQDVSGVNLLIAPGRDLRGRTTYSRNGSPVPSMRIQLRPKGFLPVLPLAQGLSAEVAADGTFTISNVPALEYSVSVSPLSQDTYVADLRQGSFSIFDIGTIAVGKRSNEDLEIVLDSAGATINGIILLSPPQLAAGAVVVLVPDERRQENHTLFKRAEVSPAGAFSFRGVAPGRYKLFAWENIPAGAEFNVEFMDAFRDEAKEITVTPGDTTAVELRLIQR